MLELGERGARNGPEDVGEGLVGPNAAGGGAQSQPDPPAAALEGAGQRAIVNQRVADGCDAADALQRLAANEHAVAGGSGRGAPPIRDPGGWIEHEEKEDKRGNHGALRESAALERRHVGYQRVVAGFGARRERGGVAWRMRGIGVGQKQIVGPQARGFADTLREGPDFARPAGLEGLGPNHGKEFGRGGGAASDTRRRWRLRRCRRNWHRPPGRCGTLRGSVERRAMRWPGPPRALHCAPEPRRRWKAPAQAVRLPAERRESAKSRRGRAAGRAIRQPRRWRGFPES